MAIKCPDCGEEMVHVKMGWECHNPNCDVIRVSIKMGHGGEKTRVMRKADVIEGEVKK